MKMGVAMDYYIILHSPRHELRYENNYLSHYVNSPNSQVYPFRML